jgi:hypothetical protein
VDRPRSLRTAPETAVVRWLDQQPAESIWITNIKHFRDLNATVIDPWEECQLDRSRFRFVARTPMRDRRPGTELQVSLSVPRAHGVRVSRLLPTTAVSLHR